MEQAFRVHIRTFPRAVCLDLYGDLTKQAEEPLLRLYSWEEGLKEKRPFLIINFTGTPYINSSGIAILIRIVRSGTKGGYRSFAFGLTEHYQKLFRMVGLTEYLTLYPDEYSLTQRLEALP